jgi:hypothetical protein
LKRGRHKKARKVSSHPVTIHLGRPVAAAHVMRAMGNDNTARNRTGCFMGGNVAVFRVPSKPGHGMFIGLDSRGGGV